MKLEDCLKKFIELTNEIAPLHAVHGPGGTWVLRRDRLKAKLFSEWHDELSKKGTNPKRTDVDQCVLNDDRWKEAIEEAEISREKLYQLYGKRQVQMWMIQQTFQKHSKSEEPELIDDF